MDPPITEVESQFFRNIKESIPKLFFILNKTDVVSEDEVAHILHFLEEELTRLQIESPEIFPLSSRQALQQKRQVSSTSASSGIESFERRLRSFLVEEKRQVLVRSVVLDVLHIARTLRFAAAIGVGQPAISMVLTRNCRPQRRTVEKIAKALDVSAEEVWPGFTKE